MVHDRSEKVVQSTSTQPIHSTKVSCHKTNFMLNQPNNHSSLTPKNQSSVAKKNTEQFQNLAGSQILTADYGNKLVVTRNSINHTENELFFQGKTNGIGGNLIGNGVVTPISTNSVLQQQSPSHSHQQMVGQLQQIKQMHPIQVNNNYGNIIAIGSFDQTPQKQHASQVGAGLTKDSNTHVNMKVNQGNFPLMNNMNTVHDTSLNQSMVQQSQAGGGNNQNNESTTQFRSFSNIQTPKRIVSNQQYLQGSSAKAQSRGGVGQAGQSNNASKLADVGADIIMNKNQTNIKVQKRQSCINTDFARSEIDPAELVQIHQPNATMKADINHTTDFQRGTNSNSGIGNAANNFVKYNHQIDSLQRERPNGGPGTSSTMQGVVSNTQNQYMNNSYFNPSGNTLSPCSVTEGGHSVSTPHNAKIIGSFPSPMLNPTDKEHSNMPGKKNNNMIVSQEHIKFHHPDSQSYNPYSNNVVINDQQNQQSKPNFDQQILGISQGADREGSKQTNCENRRKSNNQNHGINQESKTDKGSQVRSVEDERQKHDFKLISNPNHLGKDSEQINAEIKTQSFNINANGISHEKEKNDQQLTYMNCSKDQMRNQPTSVQRLQTTSQNKQEIGGSGQFEICQSNLYQSSIDLLKGAKDQENKQAAGMGVGITMIDHTESSPDQVMSQSHIDRELANQDQLNLKTICDNTENVQHEGSVQHTHENEEAEEVDKKEEPKSENKVATQTTTEKKKKRNMPKLILNIFNTQYQVIEDAAKNLNWRCKKEDPNLYINPYQQMEGNNNQAPGPEEFDLCWFDLAVTPDILYRIKPYQRISQWPGIQAIAHKNKLGKNLMQMRKEFEDEYDFFPETYMLPYDVQEFKNQFKSKEEREAELAEKLEKMEKKNNVKKGVNQQKSLTRNNQAQIDNDKSSIQSIKNDKSDQRLQKAQRRDKEKERQVAQDAAKPVMGENEKLDNVFIIKPECQSQGKGIFLTRSWEDVKVHEHQVAQRYITNAFLIDGLKFDMRIYVNLFGINPLRIFIYEDGLARFATNLYQPPTTKNINDQFMHLTNYAINKNAFNFKQNNNKEGKGKCHKRSLKQVFNTLRMRGYDTDKLQDQIDDLIIKTVISAKPALWHVYRTCQPDDLENQLCFQILGFDVMLDSDLKPWLIEVNHAPSLATDSAFDLNLKQNLVEDSIRLLNLSNRRKNNYLNKMRVQFQQRILTGKTQKLSNEEKDAKRMEIDKERDKVEAKLLGGYRMIYPTTLVEKSFRYKKLIDRSMEIYEWHTNGKKQGKPKPGVALNKGNDGEKPIWKNSGAGTIPTIQKPSKYQLTNNVKAKVNTGLQPDKSPILQGNNRSIGEMISQAKLNPSQSSIINSQYEQSEINKLVMSAENDEFIIKQFQDQLNELESNENKTLYQHMLQKCFKDGMKSQMKEFDQGNSTLFDLMQQAGFTIGNNPQQFKQDLQSMSNNLSEASQLYQQSIRKLVQPSNLAGLKFNIISQNFIQAKAALSQIESQNQLVNGYQLTQQHLKQMQHLQQLNQMTQQTMQTYGNQVTPVVPQNNGGMQYVQGGSKSLIENPQNAMSKQNLQNNQKRSGSKNIQPIINEQVVKPSYFNNQLIGSNQKPGHGPPNTILPKKMLQFDQPNILQNNNGQFLMMGKTAYFNMTQPLKFNGQHNQQVGSKMPNVVLGGSSITGSPPYFQGPTQKMYNANVRGTSTETIDPHAKKEVALVGKSIKNIVSVKKSEQSVSTNVTGGSGNASGKSETIISNAGASSVQGTASRGQNPNHPYCNNNRIKNIQQPNIQEMSLIGTEEQPSQQNLKVFEQVTQNQQGRLREHNRSQSHKQKDIGKMRQMPQPQMGNSEIRSSNKKNLLQDGGSRHGQQGVPAFVHLDKKYTQSNNIGNIGNMVRVAIHPPNQKQAYLGNVQAYSKLMPNLNGINGQTVMPVLAGVMSKQDNCKVVADVISNSVQPKDLNQGTNCLLESGTRDSGGGGGASSKL